MRSDNFNKEIPIKCNNCCDGDLLYLGCVVCKNCSFEYEVDNFGVVHFKDDSYQYEQTHVSTLKLADEVKEMSTGTFFADSARKDLEDKYEEFGVEYCLNPSRFGWTGIETVSGRSLLDLGCGFGGASIFSAKRGAESVFAVDGNLGRLRFLAAWAEKEEIESIIPIHADALNLSLQSGGIDCCIMCGSFEWIGAMDNTSASPRRAQQSVLEAVQEGLTRNGTLLVAIENRFALQNFVGYTPHLVEPPFTTVLPRRFADLVSRVVTGKPYEVYTHSYSGYQELLANGGFSNLEFYYPLPGYQQPVAVTSTTEYEVLVQSLSRLNLSFPKSIARKAIETLAVMGLAHWFMPCYILRAEP